MPKQDSRIDIRVPKREKVKFLAWARKRGEKISEIIRRWIDEAIAEGQLGGKSDASK